jgi:hypothetical protein
VILPLTAGLYRYILEYILIYVYKPSSVSIATIHAVEAILPKASGYLSPGCHAVVGRALFSLLRRRIQNGSL